jgi:hypothetical protein
MQVYKSFDIVLNAINDWCEEKNLYGIFDKDLLSIPELAEISERGELKRILDLLIEDGYLAKRILGENKSAPISYRLTAKGLTMINDEKGLAWKKRVADCAFILLIISIAISLLSFIFQFHIVRRFIWKIVAQIFSIQ